MKIKDNLDYIIVLGAHVDGTRLSMALLERTRRALQYLEKNPDTKAVLSGGQGKGEAVSEAKAKHDNVIKIVFDFHYLPQQNLYFFPLPHGQGSLRPILCGFTTVPDFFCSLYSSLRFSSVKILFH